MIFREKKVDDGYNYEVEDVFGEISIDSPKKLDGSLLDDIVFTLLKMNVTAEKVTGEVELKNGKIKYRFQRAPIWEDDDEEKEICENTHTSTKEPAKGSILTSLSRAPILSWFKRFAVAFRLAWKRSKNNH